MFSVFPVDKSQAEDTEQLGTKRKYWYRDKNDNRILFKAEERGIGEDWAEKIACQLCELIGLPHVHYELAEETGSIIPGVICNTCAPPPNSLILGNQLLFENDPDYPIDKNKYKVAEHTADAIRWVFNHLELPPDQWLNDIPDGIDSSLDVYVGYLMLDAWIGNQDRHHENWGAIRIKKNLYLAPTFDHGACLARQVSDTEKKERMTTNDKNRQIPHFARKAQSAIYDNATDKKPLSTHKSFFRFEKFAPEAARIWKFRLKLIQTEEIQAILDEVPTNRMTKISKEFTIKLLQENKRLLLEEKE